MHFQSTREKLSSQNSWHGSMARLNKFMELFESVAYWMKNKGMAMREQSPT